MEQIVPVQATSNGGNSGNASAVPSHFDGMMKEIWLALPSDKGRCGDQPDRLTVEARPGPVLRHSLVGVSTALGASLYDINLACYLILLHRQTSQAAISVTAWPQTANAPATPGQDNAKPCGQPVDVEISDQATFRDVLKGIQDILSTIGQTVRRPPEAENIGAAFEFDETGLAAEHGRPYLPGNMVFRVLDTGIELLLRIDFSGHMFRIERMQEFLAQFQILAEQAAVSPLLEVFRYSLITDLGRAILPDPSQPIEKPRYPLLSDSFLAAAARWPDAVAIHNIGQTRTYAELEKVSTALAEHLRVIGVLDSDVVALTGARGFAIVSSILGIFRSGGILLTLDPKLPLQRRQAMLQQAKAKYLVYIGECPAFADSGVQLIHVDDVTGSVVDAVTCEGQPVVLPVLSPGSPAYIFFTSGSTGVPKAVLGSHEGLAHFLDWQRKTFGITRDDRAAQITALSFDMILRDIFLALTSGATLCIPAEGDVLDPSAILSWMESERVTILHIVPTLLRAWLNNAPPQVKLPHLRLIFLAGEPLTDILIRAFRERFGNGALFTNFYGPTETTLIKCYYTVSEPEPGVQPIGQPQPQTQILILKRHRQLCGVNEPGEIGIRTPFRTLGYLNSSEATAAAFIQNPFREDPDDLVYLTGDNGRYRTDGLLEVLGRIDNQVKIRGVRVEPGEIEVALGMHPEVREAAVVAHTDSAGTKYLAGYVVLRKQREGSSEAELLHEIRSFLRAKLPDNMVPSDLVALNELPLLPNGKINRKALVAPARMVTADPYAGTSEDGAPATKGEEELLEIWKNVLGHTRVTVNDSFVELGGDSLSAISALVRMQRLGIPDSVARGIFQGLTIRQIVAKAGGTGDPSTAIAFVPKARINLLVNVVRGVLVAILVTSHWFEGLLNRLPEGIRGIHDLLLPVFNIGTPGFALVFGLGLGYIYFPKSLTEPAQTARSLRIGVLFVALGILVRGVADIAVLVAEGGLLTSTAFFNTFYSALLFYALALLTAPVWFRLIAKSPNPYLATAIMVAAAYLLYRGASWLLLDHEQEGFLQLCRLMLVAKFNYFNMSVGALAGVGAGIFLFRWATDRRSLSELSPKLAIAGVGAALLGLVMVYEATGSWEGLKDTASMPLFRWVFYAGTILIFASVMSQSLTRYDRMPAAIRETINVVGVLGQISLPVFVLHQLVLRAKFLLVLAGMHGTLALVLPLLAFFAACWWMMSKLYRLYYGSLQD
jgi:amino acid adenylation domain-containing protein